MMVALSLYAYARGNRSSRGIERACREDVAYKVITAMRVPDHSTIAEFRRRHQAALGELFVGVLALCREAGLVSVGVIAIDATKIKASASRDQNRSYEGIVAEILDEAERIDREGTSVTVTLGGMSCRSVFARVRVVGLRWLRPSNDLTRRGPSRTGRYRRSPRPGWLTWTSSARWRRGMVVRAGCARVAAGWMSAASESGNLLRGHAASVWPGPSGGLRKRTPWSARPMRPMRPITRARSAATGDGSHPRRLTSRQRCPTAGST
jgi:hypothetical protein